MRPILVLIAMTLLYAPASAQQPASDAAVCAIIAADAERLACYDAIFRTVVEPPAGAIVVESNQPIPARPTGRAPATMTISCTDEGLMVAFAFAGQLLSETSDEAAIAFQVQQTGNVIRNLPVGADNTTIGFPAGMQSAAFLESIEGGRNLQVRVTPVRQRSLQVVFAFQSQAAAIDALRESCAS